jgi:hypothetical protein
MTSNLFPFAEIEKEQEAKQYQQPYQTICTLVR